MGSRKSKDKVKILVVEDNLLNQKLTGLMLDEWGFKHDIFSNGRLAVDNLELNTYDLVLMDIHMPELDGYEATIHIRKKLKLELPIIAMTARAMPGEKEKCLEAGMTDYISKPIDEEELFNLITNYLFLNTIKTKKNMAKVQDGFDKLTNLDYLTGMSRGNIQFVQEMIDTFLIENPKEIEALDKAIKDKNFEAIRQAAHLLQSSIPFVGLDKIIGSEVCEIEKMGSDRSLSRTDGVQAAGNSSLRKIDVLFYKVRESCSTAWQELSKPQHMGKAYKNQILPIPEL